MEAATAVLGAVRDVGRARPAERVASVDLVRGVAMVLMAIDHVRVYAGVPAGGPTYGVFFTRWVTHFVAPAFVFLAGTAMFLHGRKLGGKADLSKFLVTRGLWLVLLEMTVLRLAWTFNFDFAHYLLAGVIWMLGWCMVLMAALVWLSPRTNAIAGIAIIALHNLTDVFQQPIAHHYANSDPSWLLKILYFGGVVRLGASGPPLFILFVIVPWIGVMMAGYGFGLVVEMPRQRRRKICLQLGAALTLAFLLLRAVDGYGDPRPWRTKPAAQTAAQTSTQQHPRPLAPALIRFLNTAKYPASLDFLLMTLGPMFLLLGVAEHASGRIAAIVTTFGRVPMFYYLLHIPLIHAAACLVSVLREGHVNAWMFANHPVNPGPPPAGYMWSLGLLYAVYVECVVALYFPCRWYAGLRARRKSRWLSYV